MGRPTDKSIFVRQVREAGGRAGNRALRDALGWPEDRYQSIRGQLCDDGLIERGRGQGGSVLLISPETPGEIADITAMLSEVDVSPIIDEIALVVTSKAETREIDLYDPAVAQLKEHWKRRKSLFQCVYEVTALQGRRVTGGSWSRPDIVAVGLRTFDFIRDRVLEIYSFEFKTENEVNIKGVLEALAHREAATRSYVVYYTDGKSWSDFPEAQRIEQLAVRHGVGVFAAKDINDFEKWDERVEASRSRADPEALDKFIKVTLSEENKSLIRKWS